jgi:hypothetical protein
MSNKIKIIIVSVLVLALAVGGFLYLGDIKTWVNGALGLDTVYAATVGYTDADMRKNYQDGYDDAIGDVKFYKAIVFDLLKQLAVERSEAEKKYNAMVKRYELQIAELNGQIETMIEYIEALESYIVDLGYEIDLPENERLLTLRLNVYEIIQARLISENKAYDTALKTIDADIASKQASISANDTSIANLTSLIENSECFTDVFIVPPFVTQDFNTFTKVDNGFPDSWGRYGSIIGFGNYIYSLTQLEKFGWDNSYSQSNISNTRAYFSETGHYVYSPNGTDHYTLTGVQANFLYYYYYYVVYNYQLFDARINGYKSDRTVLEYNNAVFNNEINVLNFNRGVNRGLYNKNIERLEIVDAVIADLKNQLGIE